jgi:hypothetical protein
MGTNLKHIHVEPKNETEIASNAENMSNGSAVSWRNILSEIFLLKNIDPKQRILVFSVVLFSTIWRFFAWTKQHGSYLDDEIGHYIIARDAWQYPELIFSFWGRTGCTLFFMPGAYFSFNMARGTAFLAASFVTILTVVLAKKMSIKHLWVVALLLELQPWYISNTHEILTQSPALVGLVGGILLAVYRRDYWASLFFGFLPLCRHELILITGLWCVFLLYRHRAKPFAKTLLYILATFSPMLLTNVLSYVFYDIYPFGYFLKPKGSTFYGSGSWTHYFEQLSNAKHIGLPISLLAFTGFVFSLKKPQHFLILCSAAFLFIANTIIYHYSLYVSGGFGIFLLPAAPLFAISAGLTFQELYSTKSSEVPHWHFFPKAIGAIFIIFSIGTAISTFKPQAFNGDAVSMDQVARYLRANGLEDRNIASTNVWLYRWLPLTTPHKDGAWLKDLWSRNILNSLEKGDLVVWDQHYSDRWGYKYAELSRDTQTWKKIYQIGSDEKPMAAVFEKR